jgi:hypothetical protein
MMIVRQVIRELIETFFIVATFVLVCASVMQRWDLKVADLLSRNLGLNAEPVVQTEGDPVVLRVLDEVERDCSLTPGVACYYLGRIYETGSGGKINKRLARKIMQKGCSALSSKACRDLGRMYAEGVGGEVDQDLADLHLFQACKLRNSEACLVMGQRLTHRQGEKRDVFIGFSMLASACEMGEADACTEAKAMQSDPETSNIIDEKLKLIVETHQVDET